jgi:hypothetical protein
VTGLLSAIQTVGRRICPVGDRVGPSLPSPMVLTQEYRRAYPILGQAAA